VDLLPVKHFIGFIGKEKENMITLGGGIPAKRQGGIEQGGGVRL
jgi:hypothetical protein